MGPKKHFIIILISLSLMACSALEKHVRKPTVTLGETELSSVSLQTANLVFNVNIHNPNPIGLPLKGLSYEIIVDNKSVAGGQDTQSPRIPAKNSANLALPLALHFKQIYGSLRNLSKHKKLNYRLQGSLDFGFFTIPLRHTGSIDLPSLPKVKLAQVKITKFSLSSVRLKLRVKVNNPNRFPLKLGGMQYNVKFSNRSLISGSSPTALNISPSGSGHYDVHVKLGLATLGSLANRMRKGDSMPIELSGNWLGLGAKDAPLSWKGILPILR